MIVKISILTALFSVAVIASTGLQYTYIRPEDNEYLSYAKKKKEENDSLKTLQKKERILRRKKNRNHRDKTELKTLRTSINKLVEKQG